MKYQKLFNEELSKEYAKRLSKDEVETIVKYCIDNSKVIFPLFKKLGQYTSLDIKKGKFTPKEIEQFNNIPVPKEYAINSQLPITIFRGITLSKELIKQILPKFKNKTGDVIYSPKKSNYSSWSTDKEIAESFSKGAYSSDLQVVFKAFLTSKNKVIYITMFELITFNLQNYLEEKWQLDKNEEVLLDIVQNINRQEEYEVLVFGKIKCENMLKSMKY